VFTCVGWQVTLCDLVWLVAPVAITEILIQPIYRNTHYRSNLIQRTAKTALTVFPKLGRCKQQSLNGHACAFAASNQHVKTSLSVHGTMKRCSKIAEDRSINHVTVLSKDAGRRTSDTGDRTRQVILYSVQCCYANVRACAFCTSDHTAQKIFTSTPYVEGRCSKIGEDRSIKHATVSECCPQTSDIAHRTRQVILYSLRCCYAVVLQVQLIGAYKGCK